MKNKLKAVAAIAQCLSLILAIGTLSTEARAAVVLKNFRQIYESLIIATGVDGSDPAVSEYYAKVRNRLPKEGKPEEITAPAMLGYSALSGVFCKRMIEKDKAITDVTKRQAHAAIDFKKLPNQIDDNTRKKLLNTYSDLFWQREPTGDEMNTLLVLMKTAQTANTTADLQNILIVTCTAVAASLTSLIF
jgi:hypothetical protein